ncbi:MAG TPA: EAL domain-containing protein [Jatrophihabitans sp.]|jgi:EAL domain-containing protein (putative c-di-GMP-specific phosphodiesterase class I)
MPDRRLWRLLVTITILDLLIVLTGPLLLLIERGRGIKGPEPIVIVTAVVAVVVLPLQCLALWRVLAKQFGEQQRLRRLFRRIDEVVRTGDLTIAFQPVVNARDMRVVGVEALARFGGDPLITPLQWFTDAEVVNRAQQLDLLAVRSTLSAAVDLPPDVYVAVNVSPATFASTALLSELRSTAIRPDRLVLEVTEHSSIEDYAPLIEARMRLRAHGIRLAVDDAGAGYASFRHIVALAPDIIKIDRAIVSGVDKDPARSALVGAVVMFAHGSGATVVAEGVETGSELDCLTRLGVDTLQGHLTGMPTSAPADWTNWGNSAPTASSR